MNSDVFFSTLFTAGVALIIGSIFGLVAVGVFLIAWSIFLYRINQ